jgi:hypothetical protein
MSRGEEDGMLASMADEMTLSSGPASSRPNFCEAPHDVGQLARFKSFATMPLHTSYNQPHQPA